MDYLYRGTEGQDDLASITKTTLASIAPMLILTMETIVLDDASSSFIEYNHRVV